MKRPGSLTQILLRRCGEWLGDIFSQITKSFSWIRKLITTQIDPSASINRGSMIFIGFIPKNHKNVSATGYMPVFPLFEISLDPESSYAIIKSRGNRKTVSRLVF